LIGSCFFLQSVIFTEIKCGAGTPLQINAAFQYRVIKVLWPELDVHYTYLPNEERGGLNQLFLTASRFGTVSE
jgi:hypothetical protein